MIARLISIYEKYLTQFVTKELVSSLAAKAVDHIDEHLIRQRDTTISLHPRISKVPSNSIFLTTYPGTPEANALARTAMRYGLPTIAFQHGVSREINGDHGDMGVENSSANLTFVYNQTAKLKSDETAYCHGRTERPFRERTKIKQNCAFLHLRQTRFYICQQTFTEAT